MADKDHWAYGIWSTRNACCGTCKFGSRTSRSSRFATVRRRSEGTHSRILQQVRASSTLMPTSKTKQRLPTVTPEARSRNAAGSRATIRRKDKSIWRYMSFGRFVWMLETRSLWMTRVDKLGDEWEMRVSEAELTEMVDRNTLTTQLSRERRELILAGILRVRTWWYANCCGSQISTFRPSR
jgi:hypothetical protein